MEEQRSMINIIRHITKSTIFVLLEVALICFTNCKQEDIYLHYAIKVAGDNKSELKAVLKHYRQEDNDPEKLKAAKYLIANMPAHYSYRDTSTINSYYRTALSILGTGPSPDWQRDTLRSISDRDYAGVTKNVVSDVQVMTADYLIYSIDHAFTQWRTKPWAKHLTYEEFCDWLLPYKVTELQTLDAWRDTLSAHYSDSLNTIHTDDEQHNSIYGAIEIVRNEIHTKQSAIGHRVIWEDRSGIPMRSAATWVRMTYGSCLDYVTMGTAAFRSLGLPAAVDQVPVWGRNSDGHSWYVFPSDRGREMPTMNSLIVGAGVGFYPYERIPKVFRSSYTINRNRDKYKNESLYKYPFDILLHDVTDHYCRTSDLEIILQKRYKLPEKYVYIAIFNPTVVDGWDVLDFGTYKKGKAYFKNMGRNMLYIVLGFNGKKLIPISDPFILKKDGCVEYVHNNKTTIKTLRMNLRRKYYESYNVVDMRKRILGAQIQCATYSDFKDARTLYTIETTEISDKIELNPKGRYRYWRYLAADGTYGSIAELAFFDNNDNKLDGRPIACEKVDSEHLYYAFDGEWLTNFETEQENNNWVGLDFGRPVTVSKVRVIPRSDDNDIHPGDEYELFQLNVNNHWSSIGGKQIAKGNSLEYDNIPTNTLLWLVNYTRGLDERPFFVDTLGTIIWW